ncbi:hypothetical protein B566_EDAN002404 [Ephemera danica]|nr:hypothetical protein B566_EDAN002404 [Ephemera danica]
MKVSLYFLVLTTLFTVFTALQCVDAGEPFCWAMGDPHYRTFDNKRFDFMGRNTYYLVKDWEFIVEVEHQACGKPAGRVTCTKSVTVRAEHFKIKLLQKREVTINGRRVQVPWSERGIQIKTVPANRVTVFLPNKVRIQWDGNMWITVYIPESMKGNRLKVRLVWKLQRKCKRRF